MAAKHVTKPRPSSFGRATLGDIEHCHHLFRPRTFCAIVSPSRRLKRSNILLIAHFTLSHL